MLTLAIGKSAPPHALILLNFKMFFFGGISFAIAEPEESAFAVFLILMELSDVHVSVWIYFAAQTLLLILEVWAFVYSAVLVDCET